MEQKTGEQLFIEEIIIEATMKRNIQSTLPSGEIRCTPFWMARWQVQRGQEEREWDRHQHDTQARWEWRLMERARKLPRETPQGNLRRNRRPEI